MAQAPPEATPADLVAAAVLAHPAVLRLDAGRFGTVATAVPGRRIVGVGVGGPGSAVEVAVVLVLGSAIPVVTEQLRERVRAVSGSVRVDVHVSDVEPG